ncbi:efflux RND transporter periplasmic adaptor subunit [Candidatus Cytomitobacter primus]|uniref:Efflux RND transporter periplasmic adaptor subunit n=1 Tax=Candidatus Cytomitobacter primus TaxID=2066024 RepID=A0A5C0UG95_9PROT|nr:efflux RND transporter periplasmic adaptor subunit [Candidatus Cytomitobacter primus]QEK38750.1 efflux RND transporter periplasmic adaptor subunit [Candidatus Cytomitobacter primus]
MNFNYQNLNYKRIAIASLLGIGVLFFFKRSKPSRQKEAQAIVLGAERIKRGSMSERRVFPGVLKADKSVNITAEKSATIKHIRKDGEQIKAGELIMELFDDAEKNNALSAEAVMLEQKSQYARAVKLRKENIISDADLNSKESAYKKANADYQRALSEVSKMRFKAPFNGILGLIKYNEGSVLPYNQEAAVFISDGPLSVFFSVPETNASEIKKNTEVDVYPDTQDALPKTATIVAYEPQADSTHSISIKAKLNDESTNLIPGQFVRVNIPLGMKHNIIMAPEAAVRTHQGSSYVYKIENGKANYSPVKLGIRDDGKVEIVDGLSDGDIVITEAGDSLNDGLKVTPQILGEKN